MDYRADTHHLIGVFGRAFYPVAIATVAVVLFTVWLSLGTAFVVFGLYALLGLVGGAMIHYGFDDEVTPGIATIDEQVHRLGVYTVCAVTVGVVALTGESLALVFGLLAGYAIVLRQFFADPIPERLLPQITALFLLSPVVKYLSSGQYIGHGDLLFHTRVVEDLMAGGSIEAIAYASYSDFPGLHLVASSVGSLAGLTGYDGIMLTGLAVYAVLIPAVYLVVVRITNHPMLALCTCLALVVLDDLSFYASYVFPQSLAMALIVILALLGTLVSREAIKWRVIAIFVVGAMVLAFTHHLTQVLALPLVGLGIVLYAARGREYVVQTLRSRQLALISFAATVTAIRLFQTGFVDRLLAKVGPLVGGGALGGYTQTATFGLGRAPRSSTVAGAVDWLLSPYGVYLIVLMCVFSVGVVAFLRASERPVAQTALFGCGILGSFLVFETPLSIQSLVRIRMPWLFVFAFVVGLGLLKIRNSRGQRLGPALVAIVLLLAVVTPLVTADNFYGLDPRPTMQSSFTDAEVAELQAVSSFAESSGEGVSTLWLTGKVMDRFGAATATVRTADGNVILPAGHFVYRSAWPGQKLHFTVGDGDALYANTLYIAAGWLDRRVQSTNKVYSVGGTGIIWQPTERPF